MPLEEHQEKIAKVTIANRFRNSKFRYLYNRFLLQTRSSLSFFQNRNQIQNEWLILRRVFFSPSGDLRRLFNGSSKHEDVRLRLVNHVVNPSNTLLNSEVSPLGFGHQMIPWNHFSQRFWKNDVSILVRIITIPIRVWDFLLRRVRRHIARKKEIWLWNLFSNF